MSEMRKTRNIDDVIDAVHKCLSLQKPGGTSRENCETCPYNGGEYTCDSTVPLMEDTLYYLMKYKVQEMIGDTLYKQLKNKVQEMIGEK